MQQLGIYANEDKKPLAFSSRPENLDDFYGQEKSLAIIKKMLEKKELVNLVIYGPSGVGKTTIARIIAKKMNYNFEYLNATKVGTNSIKELSNRARDLKNLNGTKTILLFDEIHRFNKAQQDSLLEDLEEQNLILIATTTENPYYALNKAILSRCIVVEFKKLDDDSIRKIVRNVSEKNGIKIDDKTLDYITHISQGDARYSLNILELIQKTDLESVKNGIEIQNRYSVSDKYDRISAMIKSIRGSDVDASIYWLASMLVSNEDPMYIARRLVISASEDIGLANPNALNMAVSCMNAVEKIGMPEARIILSECITYLALSPKSNSTYLAINKAMEDIMQNGCQEVPFHLTKNGKDSYLYPHSYDNHYIKQDYMKKKKKYYDYDNNKYEIGFMQYWKKVKGENDRE
ncbi:replication-associated recombination protein A [Oceanivirga miroungae]|uniref:Recombination factor protein RarA n=1 Tax=Oceanivirga miroungae TaxID=1130046 RepID=A0A6I8M9U8_9FUSO|nr:replication-associated recombination protein A [Oceanivirga miroungae]VWL85077.1 recombination factor protein RarA [Oceanivirga miroungae]